MNPNNPDQEYSFCLGVTNDDSEYVVVNCEPIELSDEVLRMPVKQYSSGMVARLAFSISLANESDILIIDEVLAVGDQGFQAKCLEKIYKIIPLK